jgi:hypothetical protein
MSRCIKLLPESFNIVVWVVYNGHLQVGLRKTGAVPPISYTSFLAWWLIHQVEGGVMYSIIFD